MEADKGKCETSGKQPQPTVVNREQVKAEREAKRLAKQAAKQKLQDKNRNIAIDGQQAATEKTEASSSKLTSKNSEKSKSSGKAERRREKKLSENEPAKGNTTEKPPNTVTDEVTTQLTNLKIETANAPIADLNETANNVPKQITKAERRAIQEAQRLAKATKSQATTPSVKSKTESKSKSATTATGQSETPAKETDAKKSSSKHHHGRKSPTKSVPLHRVKLFNHLYVDKTVSPNDSLNSTTMHPAIVRLGTQYSSGIVKGSNARCLAFMNAMKLMIDEYETPSQKDFTRGLDEYIDICKIYLDKCRPVAVSIANAVKFIKWQINQLPQHETDAKHKSTLLEAIDTYIRDQIDKAAEAISNQVQQKISDGDVLLTFGCSSVIQLILNDAKKSKRDFRVIVVDARPWHEGQEMLRRLVARNIKCTCVLINAVGFIMPEVTKVLLGAHALLANGYVMSRAGTAQVALVAKSYNVPVLVCCETHKFSERVLTDAFVYNEIGG